MEVAIIWLMTMFALDTEIQTVRTDSHVLETEVSVLETELQETDDVAVKTAVAHSAFYASQKVINDRLNDKIEALLERIEELENAPVNTFNTIAE